MNPLHIECWGAGKKIPLVVREHHDDPNTGGIFIGTDAESVNPEILLCEEDARKVGEWLIRWADENGRS